MNTVNGLPAHLLLVHAIVVLLPLAAFLLVLTAIWPAARRRFAAPNAILSAGTLVLVPITMNAGQWLEHRVEDTELLRHHTALGDTALYTALAVAVMALVIWWREQESAQLAKAPAGSRRFILVPRSATLTRIVAGLAIVVAGVAIYDVYLIGDSGARASWEGNYSTTVTEGQD